VSSLKFNLKHPYWITEPDKALNGLERELRDMANTRFKNGKFYTSTLTKEERWGCQWCVNLIKEILGEC